MFVNGANLSVNSVNCSLEDCSQKQSQKTEAEQELSKSVDIKIEFKYIKTKQGKTLLTSCFYVEHQHLNCCSNIIKENLSDWFKNWLGGGFWLELDNFQLYLQMAFWVNCSINSKEKHQPAVLFLIESIISASLVKEISINNNTIFCNQCGSAKTMIYKRKLFGEVTETVILTKISYPV